MSLSLDLSLLGPLAADVDAARRQLRQDDVAARLNARDHSLWKPDPEEISNRLGWLDSPRVMADALDDIDRVVESLRRDGVSHALLLGMGGSSLAPEVFRRLFGVAPDYLDLAVLDSTDPAAVAAATGATDPARTVYLPATKSGGTVETLSFLKHCYRLAVDAVGRPAAGGHFVAITDPGSGLEELALRLDFRHIFRNDPDIGGRYSALSFFGLVPARLGGVDAARLLAPAREAIAAIVDDGPGLQLGAAMGCGAAAGRDKLTLIASPTLQPFGAWIEQLVAESTGKEGRGILPVDGESVGRPEVYAGDRLFAYLRLDGEDELDADVAALAAAGHPVARVDLADPYQLGAAMVLWEVATAVAGHLMGIHPFDQPNVESAKVLARSMMEAYGADGSLPAAEPVFVEDGVSLFGDAAAGSRLGKALRTFLAAPPAGALRPYVALQAYVPPDEAATAALQRIRLRLRDRLQLATTVGFGPRFLHSTGQLHKGDGGHGLFVQVTCDDDADVPIPDEPGQPASSTSFGVLKAAQAMGDGQALIDAGRRLLRLHMTGDRAAAWQTVESAFEDAVD